MTSRIAEWKRISAGGLVSNPGSSERVQTGAWRTRRPVIDFSQCTHCMICWVMCPDTSMQVYKDRLTGVDLAHCKGCGICASECPKHCIQMVPEDRRV
ncbi:MAG: 4Fe-4S binding protein [Chloroflexi bacterium]|nr:4Fe-4S binding protein [Chloroflexota bacterium]